ncbi:MAG: CPBP family intramembrane metalloprotease [Armatimonadetes bacterium]|nr:CPBP family intramembrane metalloprotease [Armatimonadota bacterium]
MADHGETRAGGSLRVPAVLLLSIVLLAIPYFHGSPAWISPQYRLFWWFGLSFLCLLAVPCAIITLGWRESLAEYGLGMGQPAVWLRYAGVYVLVVLPALAIASRFPSIQEFYPRYSFARHSPSAFAASEAGWLVYFLAWEFFFRGFLLFTLLREFRPATAIAIQTVPFAMMHFPKPEAEALASIVAGVALGWMAFRGRSMIGTWLLHFLCAATVDVLVVAWPAR